MDHASGKRYIIRWKSALNWFTVFVIPLLVSSVPLLPFRRAVTSSVCLEYFLGVLPCIYTALSTRTTRLLTLLGGSSSSLGRLSCLLLVVRDGLAVAAFTASSEGCFAPSEGCFALVGLSWPGLRHSRHGLLD
jgi:hypothetical protein